DPVAAPRAPVQPGHRARFAPRGPLFVAVDDTLHAKGGPRVFGAGMHHDPLTSTRSRAQFQFGHCWVTLAVVVQLPFDRRPQCWTREAVLRTAPVAMLLYGLIVLWYADHGLASPAAAGPHRPWYRHKRTASFEDMVATLRRATMLPGVSGEAGAARDPAKANADLLRWFREAA
ncbi:MAG: hypothetical protein QME96_19095, partial [Myxococcota bacterium]|nr:hypothetical protein [Myxococcota bacterium]